MTEITADELRLLILQLCKQASDMAAEPDRMVAAMERIAELVAEYKRRRKPQ